ncbi:hypothetical protein ACE1TI_14415 [Alteribacillus sp. JSM 102045]|uniref:hypothetical protein n=1 Tax=Alteribacillus sp. JSM 102045 TaxID=1562101 RepID=UPI0035BFE29F
MVIFESLPGWALQNAVINALICIAWVMVHHIPDVETDKNASPKKKTSVVWAADKYGKGFSRFPCVIILLPNRCMYFWLGTDRLWAALGLLIIVITSVFFIIKMKVENPFQISKIEKLLLLFAMINAIWIGIFI